MSTTGSTASSTASSWASTTGSSSAKTPRMNPQARLMSRFYEPFVLLHVLDQNGQRITRGPLGEASIAHLTPQDLRRAFLDQLAYVCDYVKGGDTVTAMALEAQPAGVVYWVACNNNFAPKARHFLRETLNLLQHLGTSLDEESRADMEGDFVEWCIDFNLQRIKLYQRCLLRNLKPCLKYLRDSEDVTDQPLVVWLQTFKAYKPKNLPGLCRHAYYEKSSPCLGALTRHIGDEMPEVTKEAESRRQHFFLTRHYIGRLGSHIRAARVLIAASQRLPELFDNFNIEIIRSPPAALMPPPIDNLTTLDGIVKRMLPSGSTELSQYQNDLAEMDRNFGISQGLLAIYQDQDFRPRVHAEINLLEHFYKNRERMSFVDDDRFIGCSKPACYCCYHYICFHPGRFVRPATHGIRYLAWRPPDLGEEKTEWIHQRNIMNKVINEVRSDTRRQIEQRRRGSSWHPDSTSGFTYSIGRWNGFRQQPAFEENEIVEVDDTSDREERDDSPIIVSTTRSIDGISNRAERHESPDSIETMPVTDYSSDRERDYESPISSVTTPTSEKAPAYIERDDDNSDLESDIGGASL